MLLKAYFDDKRKFSHLRPHASARNSLDEAVNGIEKLNVNKDLTQQKSDIQSDIHVVSSGDEHSDPSGTSDRNVNQMGNKSDLNLSNTENKC